MKKLSHTEWAALSDDSRAHISKRFGSMVEALASQRLSHYLQSHATSQVLLQIRATADAILDEAADRLEVPAPPAWIEIHEVNVEGAASIDVYVPTRRHDCDDCKFLGASNGHDLYACSKGMPTFIARFGDEGGDYKSGQAFVGADPEITEAARRARP